MKKMVSDQVKAGNERAPHRSLFFATGMTRGDMKKPFIGICNSYESFVPGHCHLNKVGEWIKKCVIEAGGVPMEFNTIAVCDGIAMAHPGMKYSLPSRELIADSVETASDLPNRRGRAMKNCLPRDKSASSFRIAVLST